MTLHRCHVLWLEAKRQKPKRMCFTAISMAQSDHAPAITVSTETNACCARFPLSHAVRVPRLAFGASELWFFFSNCNVRLHLIRFASITCLLQRQNVVAAQASHTSAFTAPSNGQVRSTLSTDKLPCSSSQGHRMGPSSIEMDSAVTC